MLGLTGFWKKDKKKEDSGSAGGATCPECGAKNQADAKFCMGCGKSMVGQARTAQKMAEAEQITEDFKDKGGFFAKFVPGYRGYKQKEIRRESDKLLRDHLVKVLQNTKGVLSDLQGELARENPALLSQSEDMLTELDTFLRKIQHANYGMGAMFGANKVKKAELDKLIEFDRDMVENVMQIDETMKKLEADPSNAEEQIKALRRTIKAAIRLYSQRDEYIVGWTPSD